MVTKKEKEKKTKKRSSKLQIPAYLLEFSICKTKAFSRHHPKPWC
jgi:hypothetical protein